MTIIQVISQQPLTTEVINSFISVPVGIELTSEGDGDLYLSDDGTYKSVAAGGGTNLSISNKTSTTLNINSSSGADITVPEASGTEAGLLNATDKVQLNGLASALSNKQPLATVLTNTTASFTTSLETKLNGIATGATANSSDVTLLNRSNHTGTQLSSTISDFNTASDARVLIGITAYDAANPNGYTSNLGTVTTASVVTANGFSGSVATATTTPSITLTLQDATTSQSGKLTSTDWNTFNNKQAALVSGTNIKTVNGATLLGSGDLVINTTGTTNLSVANNTSATIDIVSDTGTDATIPAATTALAGLHSSTDKTKLDGIATGATANSTDSQLRDRSTHTGTQVASTISDFSTAADTRITNAIGSTVQAFDADLTAIAAISGTGLARRTGVDTWALDSSVYITGNQTITVTGDVSGSGTTAITLTLGNNVVTNADLAQVPTATFKGRVTASTGNVEDLTSAQATSLLDTFSSGTKGLVGASGGGTTNFLRADGSWTDPLAGTIVTKGTAEVDFGSGLNTTEVNSVVTGQTSISTTNIVRVNIEPAATIDHTVEDHRYAATFIAVTADTIVNGTGFTIRARTLYPMTGKFTVRWTWQ